MVLDMKHAVIISLCHKCIENITNSVMGKIGGKHQIKTSGRSPAVYSKMGYHHFDIFQVFSIRRQRLCVDWQS